MPDSNDVNPQSLVEQFREKRNLVIDEVVSSLIPKIVSETGVSPETAEIMVSEQYLPYINYIVSKELNRMSVLDEVLTNLDYKEGVVNTLAESSKKLASKVSKEELKELSQAKTPTEGKLSEEAKQSIEQINTESKEEKKISSLASDIKNKVDTSPDYKANYELNPENEVDQKEMLRRAKTPNGTPLADDELHKAQEQLNLHATEDFDARLKGQQYDGSKRLSKAKENLGKAKQYKKNNEKYGRETEKPSDTGKLAKGFYAKEPKPNPNQLQKAGKIVEDKAISSNKNLGTSRPIDSEPDANGVGKGKMKSGGFYNSSGEYLSYKGKTISKGIDGTSNRDVAATLALGGKNLVKGAGNITEAAAMNVQKLGSSAINKGEAIEKSGQTEEGEDKEGISNAAKRFIGKDLKNTGKDIAKAGEAMKKLGGDLKSQAARAAARAIMAIMPAIAGVLTVMLVISVVCVVIILIVCKAIEKGGIFGDIIASVAGVPAELRNFCKGFGMDPCESSSSSSSSSSGSYKVGDGLRNAGGASISSIDAEVINPILKALREGQISELEAGIMLALHPIESYGSGNWRAKGPVQSDGSFGVGLLQVMSFPEWQEASKIGLGSVISVEAGMSNPDLQVMVIAGLMREKTGGASKTASAGNADMAADLMRQWIGTVGVDSNGVGAGKYSGVGMENLGYINSKGGPKAFMESLVKGSFISNYIENYADNYNLMYNINSNTNYDVNKGGKLTYLLGINNVEAKTGTRPTTYSDITDGHKKFLSEVAAAVPAMQYVSLPDKGGENPGMRKALDAMKAAASKDGRNLNENNSYRGFDDQIGTFFRTSNGDNLITQYYSDDMNNDEKKIVFEQYKARAQTSAPIGFSEHSTGLAVDFDPVSNAFAATKEYSWLKNNATEFGFVQSYDRESWHWRWDGNGKYQNDEPVSKLVGKNNTTPTTTSSGCDGETTTYSGDAVLDKDFVQIMKEAEARGGRGVHTCYATVWYDGLVANASRNPNSPWGKVFPKLNAAADASPFNHSLAIAFAQTLNQPGVADSVGVRNLYKEGVTNPNDSRVPPGAIIVISNTYFESGAASQAGDINVKSDDGRFINYGDMTNWMKTIEPQYIMGIYVPK